MPDAPPTGRLNPFWRGMRHIMSLPAMVLFWSSFGYGAFVQGSGFDLGFAGASMVFVWALPAQLVLVDQLARGAGLLATAFAVTLTAVRLLPLVVSVMPIIRPKSMPISRQLLAGHFIAVTVWVMSVRILDKVPRHERVPHYFGLAIGLMAVSTMGALAGHQAAAILPTALAGGLLFLMPLYFLLSMSGTARDMADRIAIPIGLVLGPLFHHYLPQLDLALTGLVGGSLAYGLTRFHT